jgi:hypothetical protein
MILVIKHKNYERSLYLSKKLYKNLYFKNIKRVNNKYEPYVNGYQ